MAYTTADAELWVLSILVGIATALLTHIVLLLLRRRRRKRRLSAQAAQQYLEAEQAERASTVDEPVRDGLHEHTRSASSLAPRQAWEDPHKAELSPLPVKVKAASSPRTTSSALLGDPQEPLVRPLDIVATEEMRQGKGLPAAFRLERSAVELVAAEGAGAGGAEGGAEGGSSDGGAGDAARYGGATLSAAVLQAGVPEGSRARCAGALEVQELPLKAPQSAQRRFEYEVACLRRLQHINIQSFLGVVVTPKATWMLLEVRWRPEEG